MSESEGGGRDEREVGRRERELRERGTGKETARAREERESVREGWRQIQRER